MKKDDVALILAAGAGRRLGMQIPKPLLQLPGLPKGHGTFLERHVTLLTDFGVTAAVVVPQGDLAEYRFIEARGARLVANPFPAAETGSTVSVRVGLEALAEQGLLAGADILVMDCDIAYEHRLLAAALENGSGSFILVNSSLAADDEEVCVYGEGDVPRLIGKGLAEVAGGLEAMGESVGMIRVAQNDVELLRRLAAWLTGLPPHRRAYGFSKALSEHEEIWQYFCAMGRMAVRRLPADTAFAECDTAADYQHILGQVLPAIRERDGALRAEANAEDFEWR